MGTKHVVKHRHADCLHMVWKIERKLVYIRYGNDKAEVGTVIMQKFNLIFVLLTEREKKRIRKEREKNTHSQEGRPQDLILILPNASLVIYHGSTSLGSPYLGRNVSKIKCSMKHIETEVVKPGKGLELC